MKIAISVGEPSGDRLAADLVRALRARRQALEIFGVTGPELEASGCESLHSADILAVNGLVEVLAHLPRLLRFRNRLVKEITARRPDVFIGVDAPDFHLGLEQRLRAQGIPVVHYVSPTVWAWRSERVQQVARAADLLLCLFPFEAKYYRGLPLRVEYVGHPIADEVPLVADRLRIRERWRLGRFDKLVAVLPGSRASEVQRIGPIFAKSLSMLATKNSNLRFIAPMASAARAEQFAQLLRRWDPNLSIQLPVGESQSVLAAADVAMVASGTATLEALVHKCPMVVAYRLHPLTYWALKLSRAVRSPYISLPNILAGQTIVPELIQSALSTRTLVLAVEEQLKAERSAWVETATHYHQQLRLNASEQSAEAILELLASRQGYSSVAAA